jgi:hypothetical protein
VAAISLRRFGRETQRRVAGIKTFITECWFILCIFLKLVRASQAAQSSGATAAATPSPVRIVFFFNFITIFRFWVIGAERNGMPEII